MCPAAISRPSAPKGRGASGTAERKGRGVEESQTDPFAFLLCSEDEDGREREQAGGGGGH